MPAGTEGPENGLLAVFDGVAGLGIQHSGRRVVVIVGEVRADQDERLLVAPEPVEHCGDGVGVGVTDHQRHQFEVVQQDLHERQVHLQAVLRPVSGVEFDDPGEAGDVFAGIPVDGHQPQRCAVGTGRGGGDAPEGHPVGRTHQDDPADMFGIRSEGCIRGRRNRSRIGKTGMRRNQRLRKAMRPVLGGRARDQLPDLKLQRFRVVRVKQTGHRRLTHTGFGFHCVCSSASLHASLGIRGR